MEKKRLENTTQHLGPERLEDTEELYERLFTTHSDLHWFDLSPAELGKQGEAWVKELLEDLGFDILAEREKKGKLAETDLIAQRDGYAYFIEVKTRRTFDFKESYAYERLISPRQYARLHSTAEQYAQSHDMATSLILAIVSVQEDEGKVKLICRFIPLL